MVKKKHFDTDDGAVTFLDAAVEWFFKHVHIMTQNDQQLVTDCRSKHLNCRIPVADKHYKCPHFTPQEIESNLILCLKLN